MRLGVLDGRAVAITADRAVDIGKASDARFVTATDVYARWDEYTAWAQRALTDAAGDRFDPADLQNPVPEPRQIFAIGLNYADHAAESKFPVPDFPPVFTKFASSLSGPRTEVELAGDTVDWEVELVAVIGRRAHHAKEADGWRHIAGLTVGQDLSERTMQFVSTPPQFSLGKSYPGFTPMGPVVVTPDEFDDPDDLALSCDINGETMQSGRTSQMVFSVPALVATLSAVTPLLPGDVIFTGTPAGVGLGRTPARYLRAGEVLTSRIAGIGELEQRFVAPSAGR